MTMLSQYLQAERPDNTEPASFYVPGATDWNVAGTAWRRRIATPEAWAHRRGQEPDRWRRGQVAEDDAGEAVVDVEEMDQEQ